MSSSYSTTTSYRTTYVTGSYVPSGSYGRPVESYGRPVESTPLKEPEEGKWKSGLCGCFSNCCLCLAVCCCHPVTTGQLYELSVTKGVLTRLPAFFCGTIALFVFACEYFHNTFSSQAGQFVAEFEHLTNGDYFNASWWEEDTAKGKDPIDEGAVAHNSALAIFADILGVGATLCVCGIVCSVRKGVRKRDNIPGNDPLDGGTHNTLID